MRTGPRASIAVGVVVERRKSASRWAEFSWRSTNVLPGAPETPPWIRLSDAAGVTIFYAGAAEIDLYASGTENYLYNLRSRCPSVWVRLRPVSGDPPYVVAGVTADPAEGESFTEAGDDLVDALPMPEPVRAALDRFVARHHVERPFRKRRRSRADPEALSSRAPVRQEKDHE